MHRTVAAREAPVRPPCRSAHRWCRRLASVAVIALLLLSTGCSTVIVAPPGPADPVTIFVLDYGRHVSLLVPREEPCMVEYAYGEWAWFANDRDEWYLFAPTLLLPTRAALGRCEWPEALHSPDEVHERSREPLEEVLAFDVSAATVSELVERLDAIFQEEASEQIRNERHQMAFVPDASSYHLLHHCSDAVCSWLVELGCEVRVHNPLPLISQLVPLVRTADFVLKPPVPARQAIEPAAAADHEPGGAAPPGQPATPARTTASPGPTGG